MGMSEKPTKSNHGGARKGAEKEIKINLDKPNSLN